MYFTNAVAQGLSEIKFSYGCWLRSNDGNCEGCLVGAALFSQGHTELDHEPTSELASHWPWIENWRIEELPCCDEYLGEDVDMTLFLTHLSKHLELKEMNTEEIVSIIGKIEQEAIKEVREAVLV